MTKKYRWFTPEEAEYLTKLTRSGYTIRQTMEEFNSRYPPITITQVKAFRHNHHIIGTAGDGKFSKGNVPWNKGKHFRCGVSPLTEWRKNNIPWNTHPVGTIVKVKYKRYPKGYLKVKIAEPNKWKLLHVKVWEENHGPVPEGSIIRFFDGDTHNCDIKNLYCITRSESAIFSHLKLYPANEEQLESARVLARLSHIKSKRRHPGKDKDNGTKGKA